MKKTGLLIIIILLSNNLFGQNAFTLENAVDYALENNRVSKNATSDLEIANAKKWETIATGLPQINAFIDYNNNLKQPVSLVPAEFFGGNPGEFAELSFGTKQTIDGSVTLTQLLFDGSYMIGLASIKLYMDIAEKAKIKTDQEVKKATISAEMLDTANSYDDKVALIRMMVTDEAGRVSNVFKAMMQDDLDVI